MTDAEAEAPDLSVVIPVYGEAERLARCLAAIDRELAAAAPALRAEIVVADDATPGGLPETLLRDHPHVRFLVGERNLGFAGNANRGVRAARGGVVCLLNSDMYVEKGWFDACLAPFDGDRDLFALCGRICEPSGRNDGYKELAFDAERVRVESYPDADPKSAVAAEIPYASGGGSFFRRDAFEALGGFDPAFAPYYWEDADLGLRAWRRGLRIRYDPTRRLEHDHQGTIGAHRSRRVRRVFGRNQRLFVLRNQLEVPLARLLWRLWIVPALRALARLRLVRGGQRFAEVGALPAVLAARRVARAGAGEFPRIGAARPPSLPSAR